MLRAVRIGIGPIGWANDDLRDWGAGTEGERIMREMAEAGYEGSEMSYCYPQDPEPLRTALERHGLRLSGAYRWTNLGNPRLYDEEVALAKAHVDFCKQAGALHALVAAGTGSLHWDRSGPRDTIRPLDADAMARLCQGLNAVGEYGRCQGMQLCVHPHVGTAVEQAADVQRMLDGTDAARVHLCFDTGHFALVGHTPAELIRRWGGRIRYVHLKDVRADVAAWVRENRPTFVDAIRRNVFGTPGAGTLDFAAILQALSDIGFAGWMVVEADQDPGVPEPYAVACAARDHLRRLLP